MPKKKVDLTKVWLMSFPAAIALAGVPKEGYGLRPVVTGRPYLRTASHTYALPGRIKVYELDYSFTTEE